jgi:hypothetical protein
LLPATFALLNLILIFAVVFSSREAISPRSAAARACA